jgi:hypothetical protein
MTQFIQQQSPEYNIKKIWMDAYEQVSFGSGNKYPKVNEDINKIISSQGTLIFNYVGHGGENGMAHERVVTRPEISNWTNYNKLSFYITASCELAKIDNLEIESPGELMLLNTTTYLRKTMGNYPHLEKHTGKLEMPILQKKSINDVSSFLVTRP